MNTPSIPWRLAVSTSVFAKGPDQAIVEALTASTINVIDINHLNLRERDIAAAVRQLGSRLLTTHCSDNDGLDERHWLPANDGGVVGPEGRTAVGDPARPRSCRPRRTASARTPGPR
jgi:hypothetical protein